MKGTVTLTINNATLTEALQEYFDRHFKDGKHMTVEKVGKAASANYATDLEAEVTLVAKAGPGEIEIKP